MTIAYTPNLSRAIELTRDMDIVVIAKALGLSLDRARTSYIVSEDATGDMLCQLKQTEIRGWLVRRYAVTVLA